MPRDRTVTIKTINEIPSVRAAKSLYVGARAPAPDTVTAASIVEFLRSKVDQFAGLGSIIKLRLADETFFLDGKGVEAKIMQSGGLEDCTIIVLPGTLMGIANGRINPFSAFSDGRVKVRGRVEAAMKFSTMLKG
jgi:putative sterol carrier protein